MSYLIVHPWLAEDAWTGFGALAGSWIGGTGNMAAVAEGLNTPPEQFGLAVLADNLVYVVWLPILLGSKSFADRFNRWARVPADRLERLARASEEVAFEDRPVAMREYLYLGVVALGITWAGRPDRSTLARAAAHPVHVHLEGAAGHHPGARSLGHAAAAAAGRHPHRHGHHLCVRRRHGRTGFAGRADPGTGLRAGGVHLDCRARSVLPGGRLAVQSRRAQRRHRFRRQRRAAPRRRRWWRPTIGPAWCRWPF